MSFLKDFLAGVIIVICIVILHEAIHYSISKDYGCTDVHFRANWNGIYTVTNTNSCIEDMTGFNLAQSLNEIILLPTFMLMFIAYILFLKKEDQ